MDPAKMKVVDLRSELGALGLDTKGNKPALVERLKKALESKTGKALPDTSILDTTTEDVDDSPGTPRRPGPAARTRRRSSSSRVTATPAKAPRMEEPEPVIEEEPEKSEAEPESSPEPVQHTSPVKTASPVKTTSPVKAATPVKAANPVKAKTPVKAAQKASEQYEPDMPTADDDVQCVNDERSQSPIPVDDDKEDRPEPMETDAESVKESEPVAPKQEILEIEDDKDVEIKEEPKENDEHKDRRRRERVLTEEEEWDQLNERLKVKEQERLEREKLQAEEDAKKLEEVSKDPIKLQRLQRKREKKQRWSNFYQSVAITNEVLTPPTEEALNSAQAKKQVAVNKKVPEPELDDDKLTLSWYDSDLNQYLELPELNSVVPLSEGAFSYAWAGTRATHGVKRGRVCFEVRVGSLVGTTESAALTAAAETPAAGASGLRIGWSTDDSSLHLGEGALSWGYESSARAVNNAEFKEYGKKLEEKDVVGAYLDLEASPCKISYTVNGVELGVAYEFEKEALQGKAIFPHILTRNTCYKVNFGNERFNFLTKTKIVRKRLEIPVEKILEEKKAKEDEIQRLKDEAAKRAQEKKEKDKKEREERQRKKREEREKAERERKEREGEKDDKKETEGGEKEQNGQPKENGEKPEEVQPDAAAEVEEKMDTDEPAAEHAKEADKPDVKNDLEPEGPVPEVTEDQVYGGLVLDKRIKFVTRFTVDEELDGEEACLQPGYLLIVHGELEEGPRRPATNADCEVILMVGMPGSGKTYWAKQHAASHPERRYNILSTGALFDKMKVDCKPFRATYEGRWDAMVSKCAKCVLKLVECAQGRRRNYILDQTNVYPSAQRRKLREFDGYRRVAVVVIPDEATYEERQKKREEADGKEVPDGAIMDMKANFALPEKSAWVDEVIFAELNEEEAKKILEGFHKEAKVAGVGKEKEKRDRSQTRDGPPNKRPKSNDRRHGGRDDRRGGRDFSGGRDREDRWGGGGGGGGGDRGGDGGGRWGPAGGRDARGGRDGGRWGPPNRDRVQGGGSGGSSDRSGGRFNDRWSRGGGGGGDFGGGGRGRDFGGGGGGRDFGGGGGGRDFGGSGGGRDFGGGGGGREFGGGRGGRDSNRGGDFRGGRGGGGRDRGPGGPPRDRAGPPPGDQPDRFNRGDRPETAATTARDKTTRSGGAGGGPPGAGSWQRGGQMQPQNRGPPGAGNRNQNPRGPPGPPGNSKEGAGQGGAQNPSWNQWGWNQWQNWNQQNQANWGQWGNYWNNANQATAGQQSGAGAAGGKGGAAAAQPGQQGGQWPANYTAQQWYQWQQWQQQQQGWPGYGQGQQGAAAATPEQQQQMWAQYYQNYGQNAANAAGTTAKK